LNATLPFLARWFAVLLARATVAAHAAAPRLEFNRDIRPLLSDRCFKCHGPDAHARKAELRLDVRDNALAERDSGRSLVPGQPDRSELVKRIESTDADEQMPPPKSHLRLSREEIATLRRWVAQGAEYQAHWSFAPPVAAALPEVRQGAWGRNPIDRFILARLEREGLRPAAEADRATLLRRLALDLTGLPPAPEELDAFLADPAPDAYERQVERLLAAPAYGERMALDWLDGARYADSNGYFRDNARQIWPWRDWVIGAFNRNLPYDRFTIEQLAGDLLPGATLEQKIATGFNRNHMVTGESGIIDEEYRVEYVVDRLSTTSTIWLGLTVGCARCHDHKFDPISQREFYQLFSFFNNVRETGLAKADDPPPVLEVATAEQRAELAKLTAARQEAEAAFQRLAAPLQTEIAQWEATSAAELKPAEQDLAAYHPLEPNPPASVSEKGNVTYAPGVLGQAAVFDGMQSLELTEGVALAADAAWSIGLWLKPTGALSCVLANVEPTAGRRGFELLWQKGRYQVNLIESWGEKGLEAVTQEPVKGSDWQQVIVAYDGSRRAAGLRVFVNGMEAPLKVTRDTLAGSIASAQPLRIARRDNGLGFYGSLDELRLYRRALGPQEVQAWYWSDRLRGLLAMPAAQRSAAQKQLLLEYYVQHHAEVPVREADAVARAARDAERAFRAQLPSALVMEELPEPRVAHLLQRGQYDHPGDAVEPRVPASLPAFPEGAPRNRLGLAQWLTSPAHPLTARVEVNRLWQQCFGEGLVRTLNDFGAQGEPPTHPELLDWLALEFMRSGWDIKAMLRTIVCSAAYRQSSIPTPELMQRDRDNRLLARGPRFRLPAETIRDVALSAAGLLVPRVGGPSVKPYQPPGLWEAVSYDGELTYQPDAGDGLWRRSLYTFWKRQSPPPALLTFDGPTRETCTVQRARTNTPLQALALLNDLTFVEAGRTLAALALAQPGDNDARLRYAFRRVTARLPDEAELIHLRRLLAQQRARFAQDREGAQRLLAVGASPAGRDGDPIEHAAWSTVGHALLNLDEAIVRR
jgi:hypothetical protein